MITIIIYNLFCLLIGKSRLKRKIKPLKFLLPENPAYPQSQLLTFTRNGPLAYSAAFSAGKPVNLPSLKTEVCRILNPMLGTNFFACAGQ